MQRFHLFSVRAEVREALPPMTARAPRGCSEGAGRVQGGRTGAQRGCAVVQCLPVCIG